MQLRFKTLSKFSNLKNKKNRNHQLEKYRKKGWIKKNKKKLLQSTTSTQVFLVYLVICRKILPFFFTQKLHGQRIRSKLWRCESLNYHGAIIFVVFYCYCNLEDDIFGALGNRFCICMRIGNSFVESKKTIFDTIV